jgi:hypothetical protein
MHLAYGPLHVRNYSAINTLLSHPSSTILQHNVRETEYYN